MAFFPRQPW